jgi:hypothetical protein
MCVNCGTAAWVFEFIYILHHSSGTNFLYGGHRPPLSENGIMSVGGRCHPTLIDNGARFKFTYLVKT